MLCLVVLSALVAITCADHPAPAYHPAPLYRPAPYDAPRLAPAYKPALYDETPKPYAFQYGVSDSYSGSNFAAQEAQDGKSVHGSYTVRITFNFHSIEHLLNI